MPVISVIVLLTVIADAKCNLLCTSTAYVMGFSVVINNHQQCYTRMSVSQVLLPIQAKLSSYTDWQEVAAYPNIYSQRTSYWGPCTPRRGSLANVWQFLTAASASVYVRGHLLWISLRSLYYSLQNEELNWKTPWVSSGYELIWNLSLREYVIFYAIYELLYSTKYREG